VVGNFDFAKPDATMELFDVASLLAEEGALGLDLVVPEYISPFSRGWENHHMGWGKQARFLRRVRNRMLAAIPQTPLGNRLVAYNAHPVHVPTGGQLLVGPVRSLSTSKERVLQLFDCRGQPVLFATKSYGYMLREFLESGHFTEGTCQRDEKTGIVESVDRVDYSVYGHEVVIICGTIDEAELLDLVVLANAVLQAGGLTLTIVIPYFGYSTMERGKPDLHEAVKAAYRARVISSIPTFPLGNQVVLNDLHSEGIPHYFGSGVRTSHVYAVKGILMDLVKGQVDGRICTPDAGRAPWGASLVKDINRLLETAGVEKGLFWQTAIAIKERKSGSETKHLGLLGDVAGRDVFLFDDMIRSGTSAIEAGLGYRQGPSGQQGSGCQKIRFVAGHGVLPGNALERLQKAVDDHGEPLFSEVIVTNSHPNAVRLAGEFLKVKSASHILVEHVLWQLGIQA
jgi:ribose-phosphate pyrophosphokinase